MYFFQYFSYFEKIYKNQQKSKRKRSVRHKLKTFFSALILFAHDAIKTGTYTRYTHAAYLHLLIGCQCHEQNAPVKILTTVE